MVGTRLSRWRGAEVKLESSALASVEGGWKRGQEGFGVSGFAGLYFYSNRYSVLTESAASNLIWHVLVRLAQSSRCEERNTE